MVNTVWVNADHGRDLHPLADHMTTLKFTKFHQGRKSTFFSISICFQLILEQALTNVIACPTISQNCVQKLHKRASMLQWILGRFFFFIYLK